MRIFHLVIVILSLAVFLPILSQVPAFAQNQSGRISTNMGNQAGRYLQHTGLRKTNQTGEQLQQQHFGDTERSPRDLSQGTSPLTTSSIGDAGPSGGSGHGGSGLDAGLDQSQAQNMRYSPQKCQGCTQKGPHFSHRQGMEQLDGSVPRGPVWKEFPPVMAELEFGSSHFMAQYQAIAGDQELGGPITGEAMAAMMGKFAKAAADELGSPQSAFQQAQNSQQGIAQAAGDYMADAFDPIWWAMLSLQMEPLINVANEASGVPCAAMQPVKIHENAVWMVMQMYKGCYLPMAILLLLPGAVLTQTKGVVSFGILGSTNDEDAASPFVGILRSIIAIFLIPASQLIVSYCVDVGNSMSYEVGKEVSPMAIFFWADEQVFRAPEENRVNSILPSSIFPVLGKLTQGSELMSGVESQSRATIMLQALANSMASAAAYGLVMLSAFQITMACYLFLLGPIAAAFYAWPSGLGSLFTRVFTTWVDGLVNLCLWKFWWNVVLLCIDTRISWLGAALNVYSEWELIMFIAFLVILTYVPFNPFDFRPGEMVSQVMQKAEMAVGEASQGK